jgi:hypothetical protein
MFNKARKTVTAASVAAAFTAAGLAWGAGVIFDVNGAAGPNNINVDQFVIDLFSWAPGNALWTDTTPAADQGEVFVLMQAPLAEVKRGDDAKFGYAGSGMQVTFQLRAPVSATAESDGLTWGPRTTGDVTAFFDMYFDPTPDANSISGCGFGDHELAPCAGDADDVRILGGSIRLLSANWDPDNTQPTAPSPFLLDQNGSDNQNGITTLRANGSSSFIIDVDFLHASFFPEGGLGSLTLGSDDMTHSGSNKTEFTGSDANPSDQVVGRNVGFTGAQRDAAYGTDGKNDLVCDGNENCDIHTAANMSSGVLTELVPEPGSLALLSLGLGVLGFRTMRRSARRS